MVFVEFLRANMDRVKECTCGACDGRSSNPVGPRAHTKDCPERVSLNELFNEWRSTDSTGISQFGENAWVPEGERR